LECGRKEKHRTAYQRKFPLPEPKATKEKKTESASQPKEDRETTPLLFCLDPPFSVFSLVKFP